MCTSDDPPKTTPAEIRATVEAEKKRNWDELVARVEAAIQNAAQGVFGATRELEARFNEATGQVDLFVYMTVVEEVTQPEREITLDEARQRGIEAELGEELGFQIFWHPSDAAHARQQDNEFGDLLKIKEARANFGRIAVKAAKEAIWSGLPPGRPPDPDRLPCPDGCAGPRGEPPDDVA